MMKKRLIVLVSTLALGVAAISTSGVHAASSAIPGCPNHYKAV